MKKIVILLIVKSLGLGVFAQAFTLDTTFQPFFDIRNIYNVGINNLYELNSGKVYVLGKFKVFNGQTPYSGSVCYFKNGNLYTSYSSNVGSQSSNLFLPINNGIFYIGDGANGSLADSNNNAVNLIWRSNYLKTVRCRQGTPYFYPDGSSIFPNGTNISGQPCPIENPPDTFPGRHLIKVKPNGLWDSTFAAFPNYAPSGVIRYDSSRLLVYGSPYQFTHYNGERVNGLCRIFHDGTLDTTFQSPLSDTLTPNFAVPFLTDSSGQFYLMGNFFVNDGVVKKSSLLKCNADGSIDNSFSNYNGALFDTLPGFEVVYSIAETSDKGLLAGGTFTSYQGVKVNNLVKLDSLGNIEPQYFTADGPDSNDFNGVVVFASVYKILKSNFGGYYIGGDFLKWDGQPSQPIVRIHGLNTVTSIDENLSASKHDKLKVYPNPTNGLVTIDSEVGIEEIEVLNLSGASTSFNFLVPRNRNAQPDKRNIDLSNLKKGVYFLKVYLKNGEVVVKKIIKS